MVKKGQFQRAVESTPTIAKTFRSGLQALKKIDLTRFEDRKIARGSIALDEALISVHPNSPRWDYGIAVPLENGNEKVLWVEPHHAASGETARVLNKLTWLKHWLRNDAPHLDKMHKEFIWLLTNTEHPNDRRRKNVPAETLGLRRVQGKLHLSKYSNPD